MARPTFSEAMQIASNDPIKLLAMLISQQEPDGTPITGGESAGTVTATTVTISSGQSLSGTIDTDGVSAVGIVLPETFTGNGLSMQVSYDDVNYTGLYDRDGVLVVVPISQGRSYTLPEEIAPWRYVKLQSYSDADPVAQGSDRTIQVLLRS